jgi:hypothetical protein
MQKRLVLILFAIVLLYPVWALAGQPTKMSDQSEKKITEKGHPRAVVTQMEYVFDPVFEGAQIKHDFMIENHGTAPLVIQNVRPD